MEDKKLVCEKLTESLKVTRAGENIEKLEYEKSGDYEYVYIVFNGGYKKQVNVSGDSGLAIMSDVARALY